MAMPGKRTALEFARCERSLIPVRPRRMPHRPDEARPAVLLTSDNTGPMVLSEVDNPPV